MTTFFARNIITRSANIILAMVCLIGLVSAHNIPPEILDFLSRNPGATSEELQQFIASTPELKDTTFFAPDNANMPNSIDTLPSLPEDLVNFLIENPTAGREDVRIFLDKNPQIVLEDRDMLLDSIAPTGLSEEPDTSPFLWNSIKNFITIGTQHILSGWDHILFIITIILVPLRIRKILAIITIFTVAHSVTLLLSGVGVIEISSKIIEPIIALSIVYVAITNAFFAEKYTSLVSPTVQCGIIFVFGLFHGLGFAGEIAKTVIEPGYFLSSILAFNIGIEIGQILILLIGIPTMMLLRQTSWGRKSIPFIAVAIASIALVWLGERILGL